MILTEEIMKIVVISQTKKWHNEIFLSCNPYQYHLYGAKRDVDNQINDQQMIIMFLIFITLYLMLLLPCKMSASSILSIGLLRYPLRSLFSHKIYHLFQKRLIEFEYYCCATLQSLYLPAESKDA